MLQEARQFARNLTFLRVWNALQVIGSYAAARITKRPIMRGLPMAISFEPTTSCNLRCPECPSGLRSFTRPTGMLSNTLFRETIDQLADRLLYLTFYFQGEPYLHPSFLELVSYATQRGIYTATSTNAHYLTEANARKTIESGLNRLIISIDGTTQEVYEQYRIGGKLNKVIEGAKTIVAMKQAMKSATPHIVFQFLVVKPNEHQIAEVKALAAEIGVDAVWFKTAQIYDYAEGSPLIPTLDHYSRYRKVDSGRYEIKNKLLNNCWKMWHSCVITWDGTLVPCCFDKDADHPMGSLQQQNFRDIWQGAAYQQFRAALVRSRSEIDMCKNCSEGTAVWG